MEEYNLDEAKKQVFSNIKKEQRFKKGRRYVSLLRYVAVFVVCIALGYLYYQDNARLQKEVTSKTEKSLIGKENIVLELHDGTKRIISPDGKQMLLNKKGETIIVQKGNTLSYDSAKNRSKKLRYNTLTVPYGKKIQVELSDGTKVHLNAGSSLKYPVYFLEDKVRMVFLSGEAYFDVAKHKKNHFIVNVDDINVKVLGTKFNVSYFPENTEIATVLVEGSVELYQKEEMTKPLVKLSPNFIASWDKEHKDISVKKTDVNIYTAWRDGYLRYKNKAFNTILKSLEREFNVVIENNYTKLGNTVYTASFYDGETVLDVLSYFNEETHFIYKFENNKIIINKPN